ncbi:MAG TPA: SDR family oxidoreductase [Candidatus Acidoferrales bacterium]|nr:SDR family oxidoreductase [Candidatus Acidoferrales bacterium]
MKRPFRRIAVDRQAVAIVTGADSGIGLAVARKFSENGYRVVLSGIHPRAGEKRAQAIVRSGGAAIYVKADVRKESEVRELVKRTADHWGRIDVLCNNAGVQRIAFLNEATVKLWDEVMAVNARGPFLGVKYALPYLRKTQGCIINIGSTAGLVGYAGGTAYSASKAALVMMSKVWALELASHRIRVNCICPGATRTAMIRPDRIRRLVEQIPLGRIGEPQDIAELALFLASSKAKQITGGVFVVDGGVTAGRPRLA